MFLLCYQQNCVMPLYTWWSANNMYELKKWFLSVILSICPIPLSPSLPPFFSFHPFFFPSFLLSFPCSFPLLLFLPLCLFFVSMSLNRPYWIPILASQLSWNILSVPGVTSADAVLGAACSFSPCKPLQLQSHMGTHAFPLCLCSLMLLETYTGNETRKANWI